ncbi:MAG: transposase [Desulfobacteraceae bacterium]|nr:transposase [Desulfobacteraceae bacterium]
MIRAACEEVLTPERIEKNISSPNHELVILRQIIPRGKITGRLTKFYDEKKGAEGKKLRMMTAVVIVSRFYQLSDRGVVKQVKENRYIQYFCNVADQGWKPFFIPLPYIISESVSEKRAALLLKRKFLRCFAVRE